jgi:hypothetical protein
VANETERLEAIEHPHEHIVVDRNVIEAGLPKSVEDTATCVAVSPCAQYIANETADAFHERLPSSALTPANALPAFLLPARNVLIQTMDQPMRRCRSPPTEQGCVAVFTTSRRNQADDLSSRFEKRGLLHDVGLRVC